MGSAGRQLGSAPTSTVSPILLRHCLPLVVLMDNIFAKKIHTTNQTKITNSFLSLEHCKHCPCGAENVFKYL